MNEKIKYDKVTEKWFKKHPLAESTVCQCKVCGLWYKGSLGHVCKKTRMKEKEKELYLKIKPMADDLRKAECWDDMDGVLNRNKTVQNLYKMGYRKQEWISVDERLPEVATDVLVITASGSFKVGRCNIYHNGTLVLWMTNDGLGERAITHWMPLPEAPKMKGGEQG